MDPHENTKSGPEQNQPDAGSDAMQRESPRTCKICGGPNHHGCGCEAKQRRTVGMTEPTGPQPAEPTGPQPADKSSAIVEAVKVDEKLKSLAVDLAGAKVAAELIRSEAEQITRLLSDILELLKTIHNDLVRDKVQNGKGGQD